MNDLLINIGAEIKQVRLKAGLTQEQLADLIGSYKANISRIESGEQNVTIIMLEKIAKALKRKMKIEI